MYVLPKIELFFSIIYPKVDKNICYFMSLHMKTLEEVSGGLIKLNNL